jgi:hypothetical protein
MRTAAGQTSTSSPQQRPRQFATVLFGWPMKDLFRRTESGPVGWRKIVLAAACVAAATAVSLSRTVGAGSPASRSSSRRRRRRA